METREQAVWIIQSVTVVERKDTEPRGSHPALARDAGKAILDAIFVSPDIVIGMEKALLRGTLRPRYATLVGMGAAIRSAVRNGIPRGT
jgi:hypothetical protein